MFENKLVVGKVNHVEILKNEPPHVFLQSELEKKCCDTISCIIHFEHWYEEGGVQIRDQLYRTGCSNLVGYTDSDRVYHKFKNNHSPYWNLGVSIHFTQVPEDVVDTSKVDLTNTIEVEDMFELMSENEWLYATRIEEQEEMMNRQHEIIIDLLKEKKNNWAKKNSGKKV